MSMATEGFGSIVKGLASGGGGGGGSNVFVYRQAEPSPAGNVYDNFVDAYAAAMATGVPATIVCDCSIDPCVVPADSGSFDLRQVTLSGTGVFSSDNGQNSSLTIHDGNTVVGGPFRITGAVRVDYDGTGVLCTPVQENTVRIEDHSKFRSVGTGFLYDLAPGGQTFSVVLSDESEMGDNFVTTADVGVNMEVYVDSDSVISSIAFSGTAANLSIIPLTSSVELPTNFSGFTGGLFFGYTAQAMNLRPWGGNSLPDQSGNPILDNGDGMIFGNTFDNKLYFWLNGAWHAVPGPYVPEFLLITLTAPQTTGLATDEKVLFDTVKASRTPTFIIYTGPGTFFLRYNSAPDPSVAFKLVGSLGSLFDGNVLYQWWDTTNDVGIGNIAGNAGGGVPGDAVAVLPADYATSFIVVELRLVFVGGTTFIGEATSPGLVLPWAMIETLGLPLPNP